jgi:hypothetical protein
VRAEDALNVIVEQLSRLGAARDFRGNRMGPHNADVWVPDLAWRYWQPLLPPGGFMDVSHLTHDHLIPFYDAAWDLCRIGVLRPGVFAPVGQELAAAFGDQFVVTEFGREWLQAAQHRPVLAPKRLGEMLQALGGRFGAGYAQRVTEAVNTYRAQNYLSTCTMAGAAAESVLLATASAKRKDEVRPANLQRPVRQAGSHEARGREPVLLYRRSIQSGSKRPALLARRRGARNRNDDLRD